jgi:excisionase family DNA binding protein
MSRLYPPDLVSLETLAFRLDCSAGEVERLMRAGALPAPMMIGNLMRWDFEAVLTFIRRGNGRSSSGAGAQGKLASNGLAGADADPFLSGVERLQPARSK